ncbi:MAG: sodium-dependent bicarbonate transport family permease [Alphaproteobacteria bacterium]
MVAVMAVMETPAIVCGLWLLSLRRSRWRRTAAAATWHRPPTGARGVPQRQRRGKLLLGSMLVGAATGAKGAATVAPLFEALFRGALCSFLLEMGIVAGRRLRETSRHFPAYAVSGLYMPLRRSDRHRTGGGAATARRHRGAFRDALRERVLYRGAGRASPALPEANPALYVTPSLAVTFPFNIVVGIPLYFAGATALLGR